MSRVLGKYLNGNVKTTIWNDGTKVRETEDDQFIPAFAESMDICISKQCDGGCTYCYEDCTPEGKHAHLDWEFLNHMHPFTEIAINGNDLTHPDLIPFLYKMKTQDVIVNMTVNQIHFERNIDMIRELVDGCLIHGLGISLRQPTEHFIALVKEFPNAIIHVINGVVSFDDLNKLAGNGLKLLILGYKTMRRGIGYKEEHSEDVAVKQDMLYNSLEMWLKEFTVVSFDNLALEQLDVKRLLSDEEWDEFFMGFDGDFTYYVDLVAGTFSKNSVAPENERYAIMDSVDDMFRFIVERSKDGAQ